MLATAQSELVVAKESLASMEAKFTLEKEKWQAGAKKWEAEVQRCRKEGEAMREEVCHLMSDTDEQLHLHSLYLQQKALLALAEEQMQIVELEERLLQHETAKRALCADFVTDGQVMRDHKIALFQSREDALTAEIKEKDHKLAQAKVGPLKDQY